MDESIVDVSLKNQIRAKQVVEGLTEGKTYTQIAQEMNLDRSSLYAIMNKHEVQQLMIAEVRELETKLQNWIQELHESTNPTNQRHATTELNKIVRHVTDKLYPSLFRTETLNINIDYQETQLKQQIFTETLNQLPPTIRTLFWNTYNTTKKRYETTS